MRILASVVFVLSFCSVPLRVGAAEAPHCERRLVGRSYECIGATSDPAGICYRSCMTAVDAADGFTFEELDVLGRDALSLRCSCGPAEGVLPGPRWFGCTDDDGVRVMIGKATRAGRRIRRGLNDHYSGAWHDVFTCKPATSCVPTFGACAQFGLP